MNKRWRDGEERKRDAGLSHEWRRIKNEGEREGEKEMERREEEGQMQGLCTEAAMPEAHR